MSDEQLMNNTSGQGKDAVVPDEVANKFNWGAFLLTCIWGIGNNTYITLLYIVAFFVPFITPIVTLGFSIWFGIKGNEWAWRNKKFKSVEAFHNYQKKWVVAFFFISLILMVFFVILNTIASNYIKSNATQQYESIIINSYNESFMKSIDKINSAGKKCDLTSEGLALCFGENIEEYKQTIGNQIINKSGTTYTFKGDGTCAKTGNCEVTINVKINKHKQEVTKTLLLYMDENGIAAAEKQEN
ncbi:MAG: hypothetical protein IKR34_04995 [Candidatus Gastranaerophilales bacterium]|nr:hypothetical protein [Candidatus Gastranaerophilales bacterium]